jgi:hypothetical protein
VGITLTGTPVPSIPTLSEWALVFLASLMVIWAFKSA